MFSGLASWNLYVVVKMHKVECLHPVANSSKIWSTLMKDV